MRERESEGVNWVDYDTIFVNETASVKTVCNLESGYLLATLSKQSHDLLPPVNNTYFILAACSIHFDFQY